MTYDTRDLTRMLTQDGWRIKRQRGSHQVWGHPIKPGRLVIVAGERTQHPKTVKDVLIATGNWPG